MNYQILQTYKIVRFWHRVFIVLFLLIIAGLLYSFRIYTDEHAIDHKDGKYHFVKTHDYIIGSRDDHILLFRRTEDLGWE